MLLPRSNTGGARPASERDGRRHDRPYYDLTALRKVVHSTTVIQ